MPYIVAISFICSLLITSNGISDECLIHDDFSDGNPSPLWWYSTTHPGVIGTDEANGHVGFWASANSGVDAVALGMSNGWKIDMTQDWSLQADWHMDEPTPSYYGDCGLALAVVLEGDIEGAYFKDGFTISGGRTNFPDTGAYDYEIARKWNEGDNSEYYNYVYRYTTDSTLYVWYDASIDQIFYNNVDDMGSASIIPSIHSVSPSQEAWIGFGSYSFGQYGSVPSFNTSNFWADNVCLRYGNLLGPAVGGCCVSDGCFETLESMCDGDFIGAGSTCDDCAAPCAGDITDDGQVGVDDLLAVIAGWGNPYNVDDLLIVIANWNNCP